MMMIFGSSIAFATDSSNGDSSDDNCSISYNNNSSSNDDDCSDDDSNKCDDNKKYSSKNRDKCKRKDDKCEAHGYTSKTYGTKPHRDDDCDDHKPKPIKVPVPAVPSVNDPCGPNNASWNKPADTKVIFWSLRSDGHLIAYTIKGFVFTDKTRSHDYGVALDSNTACPTPPLVNPPPAAPPVVVTPPPVVVPTLITIHKVVLKPSVLAGKVVTWRVLIRNDSAKPVMVTLRDQLAGPLSLTKSPPKGVVLKNGILTYQVILPAMSQVTVNYATRVTMTTAKRVCNTAYVSADGSPTKSSRACVKIVRKVTRPRIPVTG